MSIKYNIMNFKDVISLTIPQGEVIQIQDSLSRVLWKKVSPSTDLPFYIENHTTTNRTVSISKALTTGAGINVYYSNDNVTWTLMGTTQYGVDITAPLPANGRTYLRCSTTSWNPGQDSNTIKLGVTTAFKIGGNIMSLLYGANYAGKVSFPSGSTETFAGIFKFNILDASDLILPATTMVKECYRSLFYNQTSLVSAPQLPATTLAESCYSGMFKGCTSLTDAPILPAETLTTNCYYEMFNGCTSLEEIHMLATTWVEGTNNWIEGVAETGTFYMNPYAEYDPLDYVGNPSGIPENWDVRYEGE